MSGQTARELKKLVDAAPTNVELLQKWAAACQREGDLEQAAEASSRIADCYARDGFDLKAIALLKQVLELHPARGDTRSRLVELHLRAGMIAEATEFFRQDIAVSGRAEPSSAERELFFATVLMGAGREDDARAELAKAELILRTPSPELADAVARALQLRDGAAMRAAIGEISERLKLGRELDFSMPN